MKYILSFMLLLCSIFASYATEKPKVSLPAIFGDNMVLQRDKPIPVWGWATPGGKIMVKFAGQKKGTKANSKGAWRLSLKPIPANAIPRKFIIKGSGNTITFKNVVVGDVWVCSGQSNMEWIINSSLYRDKDSKLGLAKKVKMANFPLIRQIKVPKLPAVTAQKDFKGNWKVCTPVSVLKFSAVAYFFGKRLHQEVKVPIGLINTAFDGTLIEPWTPKVGFSLIKKQNFVRVNTPEGAKPGQHTRSHLYRGMVAPLVNYAIRGVIWYQGESDWYRHSEIMPYYYKMHALVKGWRKVWHQGTFPFYWVQLAYYGAENKTPGSGDGFAKIREAQRLALDLHKTGMAVAIDIGIIKNMHPINKEDIGLRLAQVALAKEYGKKIVAGGPLYKSQKIKKGKIYISFDYVGKGLIVGKKVGIAKVVPVKNGKLKQFAIAGVDHKWRWANAVIKGNMVIVWHKEIPNPVAVRYAYSGNPAGANLYNREGFPASPFKTNQ